MSASSPSKVTFARVPVDTVGVLQRAVRFKTRSIKTGSKIDGLKLALSMIDLTTLEGADTPGKVKQLCYKALHPDVGLGNIPTVGAVCVYPLMVKHAKKALEGSDVKVASVATGFPAGQTPLKTRLAEVKYAVDEGADEVDMVINRGQMLTGKYDEVFKEIQKVKEACGEARLKVILETGELGDFSTVRLASDIAMEAGADFIKTSTGKIKPAATMGDTLVMLEAIRDRWIKTGEMCGMKPAGGIRDAKLALRYLVMVKETLGKKWLDPHWFRFGASSLANDLLMQIAKQETGRYQSADYFSKD